MARRQQVSGRRSIFVWLAIMVILLLAFGLASVVFIIGPQQQLRQQIQATTAARQAQVEETAAAHQAEIERLYQAGIAFQNAGNCAKAAESLSQVIDMEPSYKDTQDRLAEVRVCRQAAAATGTAQAIAVAQTTVEAQATATRASLEQIYQAGVAFQEAGDCTKAVESLTQVINLDSSYKDAQTRLTEARACQQTAAATATADARIAAQAAAATATAEVTAAIEAAYQRGLGYYNLERWADAKTAFDEVFAVDPAYEDIQTKLAEVEAKLAEVRKLTPTPTPRPADAVVVSIPVLSVSASGQPQYNPGRDLGFFIWQDPDGEWHLRWNGDGSRHYFSGIIRVGPDNKISAVKTYSFDAGSGSTPADKISHSNSYILFNAQVTTGDDGLDFSVTGSGPLSFELILDGAYKPVRVYIGERRRNPDVIPFSLLGD